MEFRKILEVLDSEFAEFLLEEDFKLLDLDGSTKLNSFSFQKSYWSLPTEEVTVNPNANMGNTGMKKSVISLISEMVSPVNKLSTLYLIRKYGNKINGKGNELARSSIKGELYVHNSSLFGVPYCVGLSLYPLITDGLSFGSLKSNPPSRPNSFVNQVNRYIQYASNCFSGATALTDFFPNYSFFTAIKKDYSDKEREQDLQNLVFGLTDEVRVGFQSPFSNISILGPETMRYMFANYMWGTDTKINDLIPEIMRNQLIYSKFISQGQLGRDKKPIGLPYRFPITTLVAEKSFEKEYPEVWREIVEGNTNLCHLNILNSYEENLKSLALCCRLNQSLEDLLKININSTFGSYLQVGSHAVISVNMVRIAYEARGNIDEYLRILEQRMQLARQILQIHREEILSKRRLKFHYFFAKKYLDLHKQFFSTLGFIGLSNAIEVMGTKIIEPDGLQMAKKIMQFMKETSIKYAQEDNCLYNIEEVPAESASGTLAQKDKFLFKGQYDYYDSQFVPLSYDVSLSKRIEIEGELQTLCTGGSISHLNIKGLLEPETTYNFTMKCLLQSKLRQFALNKGFTCCVNGHNTQGIYQKCPICNSEDCDWETRVVGYFTKVSAWNKAKKLEFKTRRWEEI